MKKIILLVTVFTLSMGAFAQEKNEEGAPDILTLWKQDSQTIMNLLSGIREYRESSDDTDLRAEHKKEMLNKKLVEINKKYQGTELHLNAVMVEEVKQEKNLNKAGSLKMLLAVSALGEKRVASESKIKAIIKKAKRDKSDKNLTAREKQILKELFGRFKNPLYQFAILFMMPTDDKYYDKTGNFEITYHIPVPKYSGSTEYRSYKHGTRAGDTDSDEKIIEVMITQTITDKEKAMEMKKGSVQALQGTIESIHYKGGDFFEKIRIDLK